MITPNRPGPRDAEAHYTRARTTITVLVAVLVLLVFWGAQKVGAGWLENRLAETSAASTPAPATRGPAPATRGPAGVAPAPTLSVASSASSEVVCLRGLCKAAATPKPPALSVASSASEVVCLRGLCKVKDQENASPLVTP